jgi:putative toxin-antitoxin system antitoxin component (TIGR02293 family)
MANTAQNNDFGFSNERDILFLIKKSREGMKYTSFAKLQKEIPLKPADWSRILHLSERTLQRYKKEKIDFAPIYSEKIFEIKLLFRKGIEVFGMIENFSQWLHAKNIALGGIKPISLLDNTFGITLLNEQLTRIEHGVLA